MSMYGDSESAREKEDVYFEIKEFLKTHSMEELLRIIADVLEFG